MNNCQRIAQVFREANKCTMTRSELESALHRTFRNIKDFLIRDHFENNKRDAAGNPIGGAAGRGSGCRYRPKGCIEVVVPGTFRLTRCDDERRVAPEDIQISLAEPMPTAGVSLSLTGRVSAGMSDPLSGFDWHTLYPRYDAACEGFNPQSTHISGVSPPRATDRELYYWLVASAAINGGKRPVFDPVWYEALLYWKLYSSMPESKITGLIKRFAPGPFRQLLDNMPATTVPRNVDQILELIDSIGMYQVPGMVSYDALPVRTTFLHMLYPTVIPIFDKMVLKAVGAWKTGANKQRTVLRQYLPHAWTLAARHTEQLRGFQESPIRLVDMALWVERGAH